MGVLEARNLTFLDNGPLDISIQRGECVSLMGPSGSGKTLLLRSLADLDAHGGEVFFDGTACSETPAHEWRRKVGFLSAESAWWRETVGEHFNEPPAGLSALGFEKDILDRSIEFISSGEKQRLGLLRLLDRRPGALLLDEPTANLDPENTARVEELIEHYRMENGVPVLWVCHSAEQAGRVARRTYLLEAGRLVRKT